MSYAIETKKRKFHRVLESISKPLTGDTTSKQSNQAQTQARPSTAQERNLSIKKARLNGDRTDPASARASALLKVSRPSSRSSSVSSSTSRPSFVPWDRERFLERLGTFRRVDRWSSKPAAINEVQWAKRGWICTDASRVSCVGGCGGSVVVKLPEEIDELDGYDSEKVKDRNEVRAKLVEEYSRLLVEGHGENCPWRNKGCDATIHRLPLTNPDFAIANLQKRYANLAAMETQLPDPNAIQTPEGFNVDEVAKMLPAEFFQEQHNTAESNSHQTENSRKENNPEDHQQLQTQTEDQTEPPKPSEPSSQTDQPPPDSNPEAKPQNQINKSALALASLGWDNTNNAPTDTTTKTTTTDLISCAACFRRLGLWLYKPRENGTKSVYGTLDAANEHMEYCPWISREAQSGTGTAKPAGEKMEDLRSGWELLVLAGRALYRRRVRSMAAVASVDGVGDGVRGRSASVSVSASQSCVGGDGSPGGTGTGDDHNEGERPGPVVVDEETKKVTDREWWARIRRMKQVLNVRAPRGRKGDGSR